MNMTERTRIDLMCLAGIVNLILFFIAVLAPYTTFELMAVDAIIAFPLTIFACIVWVTSEWKAMHPERNQ